MEMIQQHVCLIFFFFNDTATTEIYTLSLHDALPIYNSLQQDVVCRSVARGRLAIPDKSPGHPGEQGRAHCNAQDRKSTRLNSSHLVISYAVFCLKKKQ